MIHVYVSRRNRFPIRRLERAQRALGCELRIETYQDIFGRRALPRGPAIFTDFDLLHSFETDAAGAAAAALAARAPGVAVLNRPAEVLQRVALLHRLHAEGLNPVEVTRLDTGGRPRRYPVFLRAEGGCAGPETGLIEDAAGFEAACAGLKAAGRSLTGRIAVSYHAERDAGGYFRKYGAFVIGDRIIPQHILRGTGWTVKSGVSARDAAFAEEERAFVEDNPHDAALRRIAAVAGTGFGRIDYTLIDGQIVVYEINTNPTFPRFVGGDPAREARRRVILQRLGEALGRIDGPSRGWVPFELPSAANSSFIERDRWYRHPLRALARPERWRAALTRWQRGADPARPTPAPRDKPATGGELGRQP